MGEPISAFGDLFGAAASAESRELFRIVQKWVLENNIEFGEFTVVVKDKKVISIEMSKKDIFK